jgi:hypothetical protein
MTAYDGDREFGFAGMVRLGLDPEDAWRHCRADAGDPEVRAILDRMHADPAGREALEWSRRDWAAHGMRPPWDDPDNPDLDPYLGPDDTDPERTP